MSAQTRSAIIELLDRHGLHPRKAYGQHFLADPNLIAKVVKAAEIDPADRILEVGAGTGALTLALAEASPRVLAYEIDERMRPVLDEMLAGTGVDLRFADIMHVDLEQTLGNKEWKLVSNLPYNVGTPLLLRILTDVPAVEMMVVMVQSEVADRLTARPDTSDYGIPSVVVALTARVTERFSVPPQVFVPPPSVGSSVVVLRRVAPPERLTQALALARTAFGQRRKMLRRSLAAAVSPGDFEAAGIESGHRPQQLTPQQFVDLAEVVGD